MRVAHFGKYAYLRMGGIERHVVDLTTALAACGVDVTVFSYDLSKRAEASVVNGVRVEPVRTMVTVSSQSLAPQLLRQVRQLDRKRSFDVIHQHWPDPFAHVVASMASRACAQVVSWHMDIVRQKILLPVYTTVAPRLLALPDAIIGATAAHLASVQVGRFAPPHRRHVIPFGIDARPFHPTSEVLRSALALRTRYGGGPILFALGRHVYYKGFEVLIRAMAKVPALLLLGGEGPLTPELRRLTEATGARVEFVGPIAEKELPSYYHACDIFCFPSVAQTEAFGLVQAEAMLCGKPIVNTELGNGVNDLAPHNLCALTVPPGDEDLLADALCRVLRDRGLAARLGSAGRERVLTSFTVENMVQRTIDLYERVVRERGRR